MATNAIPARRVSTSKYAEGASSRIEPGLWRDVLEPLASLKITVVLFACSIFLILVGTLAQVNMDMWEVIAKYFRSWIAWIPLQVFFPSSWFPRWQNIPGGFWFPGGATVGLALVINLLAAHLVIFKVQARGLRLVAGLVAILLGIGYTAMVISSGHNPDGLQGESPFAWTTVWLLVKISMAVLGLFCGVAGALRRREDHIERTLLWVLSALLLGSSVALFLAGSAAYLGDSGMRIMWQLIQGSIAAAILLVGCNLLFGVRGGRVLLHGGVALMMFGQFFVAKYDVEEQLSIEEGQTISYARDIRQTELAIVDSSNPAVDRISAIPLSLLHESLSVVDAGSRGSALRWMSGLLGNDGVLDDQGIIRDKQIPFGVKVLQYHKNATLQEVKAEDTNVATAGTGLRFAAVPLKGSSGTEMGSKVDMAAAYVQLVGKDGSSLGTFLVSQLAAAQGFPEKVQVDGKTYDISLRFRQNYKPYSVTLLDVRKDDYLGTNTPRNYSSTVRLVDASRDVDRQVRIWMNNPLRYAGETFYQSGYSGPPDFPVESTTLQVVTNSGWMIPYVACMIVWFGMAAQFVNVLVRFLRNRAENATYRWTFAGDWRNYGNAGLALLLLVLAAWALSTLLPARVASDGMDIDEFGQLPLVADGRVKPFDTLARNTLRVVANRETFKDSDGKRQPATRWLLDVIADPATAEKHRVFRIVNLEVLDTLGLKRRKGNLYSVAEIRRGVDAFEKQVTQARQKDADQLSVYERKLLELDQQIRAYTRLAAAFQPLDLSSLLRASADKQSSQNPVEAFRSAYSNFINSLDSIQPALAVPLKKDLEGKPKAQWQSYARAWTDAYVGRQLLGQEPDEHLTQLAAIFSAYSANDAAKFNQEVAKYHKMLQRDPPAELKTRHTFIKATFGGFHRFEAYFNHVSPFLKCFVLYLIAFILTASSWLGWNKPLNRAAFLLIIGTAAFHTLALAARVYISGRPPVTNLYSSAVFIGWGGVMLAIIFELLYRNGVGNVVAAILGAATLLVAHNLAAGGDTFTVLQAVLDTQFWLATHVVCISLGYATTFIAGVLGAFYIVASFFTRKMQPDPSGDLKRMIYGSLCFAIFFSFVGTVLGGLWADDSWGRFWGWDPKENGALIIVLWNDLVLHARWGGMVRERGLAVLAVVGNIVTSWSWFGVNELGVGLHSYGFTEGVLQALGGFILIQLLLIVLGIAPALVRPRTRLETAQR